VDTNEVDVIYDDKVEVNEVDVIYDDKILFIDVVLFVISFVLVVIDAVLVAMFVVFVVILFVLVDMFDAYVFNVVCKSPLRFFIHSSACDDVLFIELITVIEGN
jgi:hypothetical protein